MPRCAATTKNGKKCVKTAVNDTKYCAVHANNETDTVDITVDDSVMNEDQPTTPITFPVDKTLGNVETSADKCTEATSKPTGNAAEEENKKLKDEIAKLQAALQAMTMHARANNNTDCVDVSKLPAPKQSTVETKAKWLFYQAIKGQSTWYEGLRNEMRGRLVAAELIAPTDESIDWRLVKAGTDKYFNHHLAIEEKNKLMEKAYAKIMEAKAARRIAKMNAVKH